jgi:hypothetical protein
LRVFPRCAAELDESVVLVVGKRDGKRIHGGSVPHEAFPLLADSCDFIARALSRRLCALIRRLMMAFGLMLRRRFGR